MEQWSDEVELYPETQRFGNRAFRKYIAVVEEVSLFLIRCETFLTMYAASPLSTPHTAGSNNPNPPSPPSISRIRTPRPPRLRIRPRVELCAFVVRDGSDGVSRTR